MACAFQTAFVLLLTNSSLSQTLSGSGGCIGIQNEHSASPLLFFLLLTTRGSQEDLLIQQDLLIIPTRKWEWECGFPLRSHTNLLARLELETISLCSQLATIALYCPRQDLAARADAGKVPFGSWPLHCPWIVTFQRTPHSLSLRNDLPRSDRIKESPIRLGDGKQSI